MRTRSWLQGCPNMLQCSKHHLSSHAALHAGTGFLLGVVCFDRVLPSDLSTTFDRLLEGFPRGLFALRDQRGGFVHWHPSGRPRERSADLGSNLWVSKAPTLQRESTGLPCFSPLGWELKNQHNYSTWGLHYKQAPCTGVQALSHTY